MISTEDLVKLQSEGAELEFESNSVTVENVVQIEAPGALNGLEQSITQGLGQIAESNEQGVSESIDRLAVQISNMKGTDITPALAIMVEILKKIDKPSLSYKSTVVRDNRGQILEIISEPYESD